MFKGDSDEKSEKFNPKTSCTEYKIHIYPSLKNSLVCRCLGMDPFEN